MARVDARLLPRPRVAIAPYAPLRFRLHRPRVPGNLAAGYPGYARVDGFGFMGWDKDTLVAAGLPAIDYPIPNGPFEEVVLGGGQVPNAQLLAWLQGYAETDAEAWWAHWPVIRVPCHAPREEYLGIGDEGRSRTFGRASGINSRHSSS